MMWVLRSLWIRNGHLNCRTRFIGDQVTVFIDQIEFADNEVINKNLAPGNVLYVFSGKKEIDDGWEMVIKMVMQDRNSVGTSFID